MNRAKVGSWTGRTAWLLVCLALPIAIAPGAEPSTNSDEAAKKKFDEQIAPLLASRCLECHAGLKPQGGLDLSEQAKARAGGESGPAIVPSKLDESLLWQRVKSDEMPPKHPLTAAEKETLRSWIASGAAWGTPTIDRFRYSSERRAGYDWWSLQPIRAVAPPAVARTDWPKSDVDRFILKRLEENGLTPSPAADPRSLVRRIYFDLIGLPPPPEVIAQFRRDPSEAAYKKLVDDLLASPHYGERWGRHWLDVVRYGESDGFERNNPRKNSWPYRDWVIQAFNDDLPYDQFVRMQLIGDLLDPGPRGAAAMGMLVAGVHNTVVGSSERMKRLARQDELEEMVSAVGQTFLGLTVHCARCHDHKFDPISSPEYYRLIATIDGVQHGERDVLDASASESIKAVDERMAALRRELEALDRQARERVLAERQAQPTKAKQGPRPLASWEFDEDLRDSMGKLHGTAFGGAKLEGGALVLDGKDSYVVTGPLEQPLAEKTLEAWVMLPNLSQAGGGVVSVETPDGGRFDALVYGEREPKRWMAGSNFFERTQPFQGPDEQQAAEQPVHVAIVYRQDGTITAYRDGLPYGRPYKTGFLRFEAGQARVLFGLRHSPPGGNRLLTGKILRANLYDQALDADAIAASAGRESNYVSEQALVAAMSVDVRTRREALRQELHATTAKRAALEARAKSKMYTALSSKPSEMRIHVRGSVTDFGDVVAPSGLKAIQGVPAEFGLDAQSTDADRRRRLADWLTHADNPLFARVIVNRVWHYHFGAGLVETPSDLGFNGGQPSHPELLDWLAAALRSDGWRLKSLHRRIVMSATYRQSSLSNSAGRAKDANNRLLWRASPRRVEGEEVRDAILQVAGLLQPTPGGPGFEDVSIVYNNGTTYYEPLAVGGANTDRRTVYRFTPRGGTSPLLDAFDCPDPSGAVPRRSVTTTPLQALSLLNNQFVLRAADQLAQRCRRDVGDDIGSQIRRAWELSVGRAPDDFELRRSRELVDAQGLPALGRALFNSNEFVILD